MATDDFPDVMRSFLDDGTRILVEHIPFLLQKLHNLAAILLSLHGFRFYGCSLLLIYDGDREVQDHFIKHSKPVIDGAIEDSIPEEDVPTNDQDDDEHDEYAEHRHRPSRTSGHDALHSGGTVKERRSMSMDNQKRLHHPAYGSGGKAHRDYHSHRHSLGANTKRIRGEINLRVVDFAHTTTGRDFVPLPPGTEDTSVLGKGYESRIDEATGLATARFPPKHAGEPDKGFVFGLKSLAEALREIWDDEMDRRAEAGEEVRLMPFLENATVFDEAFADSADLANLST